jgi:benzil reductase ((S)-benzoin forming)
MKRKVFITGTSSGLGFDLAKYYLNAGCRVYGISRRMNEELNGYADFHFLVQDVSRFREIETNLISFLNDVEILDLVILNAGILGEIKDLKDTSLEQIHQIMEINVWANKVIIDTLYEARKEIRQLVAVSSGASVSGARGWNAYSLSKATLNMLVRLYSKEFVNTHFTALAPGLIDTAMQDYIFSLEEEGRYPVVQRLQEAKRTGQMPKPEDTARRFAEAVDHIVRNYESGSYLDLRKL